MKNNFKCLFDKNNGFCCPAPYLDCRLCIINDCSYCVYYDIECNNDKCKTCINYDLQTDLRSE